MSTDICQKSKVLFLGNISPMDILKKVWRGEGGEKGWFIPPTQKKGGTMLRYPTILGEYQCTRGPLEAEASQWRHTPLKPLGNTLL